MLVRVRLGPIPPGQTPANPSRRPAAIRGHAVVASPAGRGGVTRLNKARFARRIHTWIEKPLR